MDTRPQLVTSEFRALSARLGSDPLQVQGPGGNTSIKDDEVMWIKASGTELAHAEQSDIFVAIDLKAAIEEAHENSGDGSCKAAVLDPSVAKRPSIETTFHAALPFRVIAHTHSVVTLVHAISAEGRLELDRKLSDLPFVRVPYAKPGLPLTREILKRVKPDTCVIILENHGLICCGDDVASVDALIRDVEERLALPIAEMPPIPTVPAPDGYQWAHESWLAVDPRMAAQSGSYYPDHVVFLGPALPTKPHAQWPAHIVPTAGVALKQGATPSQRAMLRCLSDVLRRLPQAWTVAPIGPAAEAELLNWDAEKYRQALAAR